jgi:hypothetical protein
MIAARRRSHGFEQLHFKAYSLPLAACFSLYGMRRFE